MEKTQLIVIFSGLTEASRANVFIRRQGRTTYSYCPFNLNNSAFISMCASSSQSLGRRLSQTIPPEIIPTHRYCSALDSVPSHYATVSMRREPPSHDAPTCGVSLPTRLAERAIEGLAKAIDIVQPGVLQRSTGGFFPHCASIRTVTPPRGRSSRSDKIDYPPLTQYGTRPSLQQGSGISLHSRSRLQMSVRCGALNGLAEGASKRIKLDVPVPGLC
jgi:hypothetical protein